MKLRCPGTWMTILSMSRFHFTVAAAAVLLLFTVQAPAASPGPTTLLVGMTTQSLRLAENDGISLDQAVNKVRQRYGDITILKAESRGNNGKKFYRIKFLTDGGRVRTVKVDAQSGKIR
ncbi:MAG: PepSY domain-containing protein [Gammaproteobacteria bacterium]